MVAPARHALVMFSRCIRLNGVSLGSSIRGRLSLRQTSAERVMRLSAIPAAMDATVFMEHGAMAIPSWINDPLAGAAELSC